MPDTDDPSDVATLARMRVQQEAVLRLTARAVRTVGPAAVLATIDSLDERGVTLDDVLSKLQRFGQVTGNW